jgi:hypothetical protein
MMARALLIFGWLGTAGLIAAAVLGYTAPRAADPHALQGHVLMSLGATLVVMFSHTWILLYLLATGRVLSQVAAARGFEPELAERARRLRLRALPWLLVVLAAVTATFLLGGNAFGGRTAAAIHHALFYVTLVLQLSAMTVERRVLAEHEGLSIEVARRAEPDAA